MSRNVYKPFYKKWVNLQRPIFGEKNEKIQKKFTKEKWQAFNRFQLKPSILKRKQRLSQTRFIFGKGLKQKKALKMFYGLKERQVKKIVRRTNPYNGSSPRPLGGVLEQRLGTVLYRLNFVESMAAGRQLISHKKIKVNGKKVWAKNYAVTYLDLLEVDDASTRRLVNRIKSGKSIMRLQTFSEGSVSGSTVEELSNKAQHAVRTYKDHLKNSVGDNIVVGDDGDSLVPVNVNKVTNIAPIENATSLSLAQGQDEFESKTVDEDLLSEVIESTNELKNRNIFGDYHPALGLVSQRPKDGDFFKKHVHNRWEEQLNEQILVNVGNSNFLGDNGEIAAFHARQTVVNAIKDGRQYEERIMKDFVERVRESTLQDIGLEQGVEKLSYSPWDLDKSWTPREPKKIKNPEQLDDKSFLLANCLKRPKYKPFLPLRKPSLERKKRIDLLKILMKNKEHPNMQIDYKNMLAVYVKALETDEVKYPFDFSFKEFLEFYNI